MTFEKLINRCCILCFHPSNAQIRYTPLPIFQSNTCPCSKKSHSCTFSAKKPSREVRTQFLFLVSFSHYDLGFSFFSFHNADRPTPETLTTLKRTPGISPFALPFRPKPARRTSSFSSTKLRQPSFGTR